MCVSVNQSCILDASLFAHRILSEISLDKLSIKSNNNYISNTHVCSSFWCFFRITSAPTHHTHKPRRLKAHHRYSRPDFRHASSYGLCARYCISQIRRILYSLDSARAIKIQVLANADSQRLRNYFAVEFSNASSFDKA